MKFFLPAVLAALTMTAVSWAADPRMRQPNDFGWKFNRGDQPGAEAAGYNDAPWQSVNLPHDWSIFGLFDTTNNQRSEGALLAGMGWYRKVLNLPADYRGNRVFLEFDGIYENGSVFVNDQRTVRDLSHAAM
jgi:beta-galactosidase